METKKIFRIDHQLNHVEIDSEEINEYKAKNTLHFIEIFFDPYFYKNGYTYLKFKAYDTFYEPSCLQVGNIKAMGTRESTFNDKWDASEHQNIDVKLDNSFVEIGPQYHMATYEILVQDINYKNRILPFSRANKNTIEFAINPIIRCLEKMKELNEWGTWKAYDMSQELEKIRKEKEEVQVVNNTAIKENDELRRILKKISKETKAINRLAKILRSDSLADRLNEKE